MLKNKSGFSAKKRKELAFYIAILALPITQVLVFYFYVNINSFILAFQSFNGTSYEFTGFDNFKAVFTLDHSIFNLFDYGTAIKNSGIAWLTGLITSSIPALFFSYYIYKNHIGSSFFRIILYIPHIIPLLVFILVYKFFMNDFIIALFKIEDYNFWMKVGRDLFYYLFCGWMLSFGTSTLVYTGTMSGISDSIIESGQLDGITPTKELFLIVIPMIWGTFVTMTITSIIGFFTGEMHTFSFEAGNLDSHLYTFGYFIQRQTAYGSMATYPILSAFGLIMTAVVVPITILTRHLMLKYGPRTE